MRHFARNGVLCQQNPNSGNLGSQGPPTKKEAVSGGKTPKKLSKKFLRLRDAYKKYILQKNWVKTAIPALSSGQSNLQTPIWGCHRQLDDQYRNPNMNNKDHLVGQLTRFYPESAWLCCPSPTLQNHPLCWALLFLAPLVTSDVEEVSVRHLLSSKLSACWKLKVGGEKCELAENSIWGSLVISWETPPSRLSWGWNFIYWNLDKILNI